MPYIGQLFHTEPFIKIQPPIFHFVATIMGILYLDEEVIERHILHFIENISQECLTDAEIPMAFHSGQVIS